MTGIFEGIEYTMGSGLMQVCIRRDGDGVREWIPAEAGPTFRALDASGIQRGDRIVYEAAEYGLLESIGPLDNDD